MSKSTGFKVGVVGCGKVGMTAAFAMLLSGTPSEIVLIDRTLEKVEGEKLDLEHALPFLDYVKITASDDFSCLSGCDLVVYSAGAPQKVGETRLDLCENNKNILRENLPKIIKNCPEAIILIVANPVDVLTHEASKIAPSFKGRVFGSGTMLDTARFRFHLAEKLKINPHSVHTYVLGEHGDTSFPVFENALVGGQKLLDLPGVNKEMIMEAYQKTRDAAYKIIEAKGATYYAIGVVVTKIMEAIASNSRTVYPLSVVVGDVALSMPCVLGSQGIERVLEVEFSEREKIDYDKSVLELKKYCQ
jgi:L-lactate dehydrogenase